MQEMPMSVVFLNEELYEILDSVDATFDDISADYIVVFE